MIENEFALNLYMSLAEVGVNPITFWPPSWTPDSQNNCSLSVQDEIRSFISKNRITHLILDANMNIKDSTINAEWIMGLKEEFSLKVIVIMLDYNFEKMTYWGGKVSDVFVHSRPDKFAEIRLQARGSIVSWPGSPYPRFQRVARLKEFDFFFSGSSTRGRKEFLSSLGNISMTTNIRFGERIQKSSYSYSDYIYELSRSRMTFSNGYIDDQENMITGRALESFATKTLVFYETSRVMEAFFEPFVHFVPVNTASDLAYYSEYFLHKPKLLSAITDGAYNYYYDQYSSYKYWGKVFSVSSH
jgi:hypothetical protein